MMTVTVRLLLVISGLVSVSTALRCVDCQDHWYTIDGTLVGGTVNCSDPLSNSVLCPPHHECLSSQFNFEKKVSGSGQWAQTYSYSRSCLPRGTTEETFCEMAGKKQSGTREVECTASLCETDLCNAEDPDNLEEALEAIARYEAREQEQEERHRDFICLECESIVREIINHRGKVTKTIKPPSTCERSTHAVHCEAGHICSTMKLGYTESSGSRKRKTVKTVNTCIYEGEDSWVCDDELGKLPGTEKSCGIETCTRDYCNDPVQRFRRKCPSKDPKTCERFFREQERQRG